MHVHNAKLEHASLCEPILKFDIVLELFSKQKNQVSHTFGTLETVIFDTDSSLTQQLCWPNSYISWSGIITDATDEICCSEVCSYQITAYRS